jgi:hypothetical protein
MLPLTKAESTFVPSAMMVMSHQNALILAGFRIRQTGWEIPGPVYQGVA